LIVSISTTGQGDVPRNGQAFWKKLLRKKLPPTLLSGVRFGIYGLGDTSYPNFNYAALKLSKRLTQLGATELLPIGAADEQHPEG
jgi:sulfite reductase alpha subunit-like flavoprotein